MALIAASTMSPSTAAVVSFTAASTSDTFATPGEPGKYFVVYRNGAASTRAIAVVVPGNTSYGAANPDPAYTLAVAGTFAGELWIPIHPTEGDPSTGLVTITCSVSTSVTVAYVRIA